MSLKQLITGQIAIHEPYTGQDERTGANGYGVPKTVKGRFGEGNVRFDSQEATDQVGEGAWSGFDEFNVMDRLTHEGISYLIVNKYAIRKGRSEIVSHYNYVLKIYDNAQ